jgi:hypothetical protein
MEAVAKIPTPETDEPTVVRRQSKTQGKLVLALARAKKKFTAVAKTKEAKVPTKNGGEYRYQYADLADIVNMSDPPLLDEELVVFQDPKVEQRKDGWFVTVTSELRHSSDEWRSVEVMLPCLNPSAQGIGSTITYARRYGIGPLLGIVTEKDDDAQVADAAPNKGGHPNAPQESPEEKRARWEAEKAKRQAEHAAREAAKNQAAASAQVQATPASSPPAPAAPAAAPAAPAPKTTKSDPRLRARAMKVWDVKKAQGMAREGFAEWCRVSLDLPQAKPFDTWTAEDVEKLEIALHRELGAEEPGSRG